MIKIIKTVEEMRSFRKEQKNVRIGFVPTMGALHSGHETLIQECQRENNLTVVSIFVNPTQFNNLEDFEKYPATYTSDLEILNKNKVDILFYPNYGELYPDQYKYKIVETDLSRQLCGIHRPGHFEGVLTVVLKLFNIIKPNTAYFGEKDYQQLKLIEGLVKAFFIDTKIIPVKTVRDEYGLALSSRNERLSIDGLTRARTFASILKEEAQIEKIKDSLEKNNIEVEYVSEFENRKMAAVYIDNVRLIDNA